MSEDLSSTLSSSGISQMEDWCSASASSYLFELLKAWLFHLSLQGPLHQRAFCSICLRCWHDCAVPSLQVLRTKGASHADHLYPAGELVTSLWPQRPQEVSQAQQSLGWLVFAHLCKNNYGLTPLCPQYVPLKICLHAWSLLSFRIVPRNTQNLPM